MAQFDSLIIFPVLWSLLLVLFLYYGLSLQILLPDFFGTQKFRDKKLSLGEFYGLFDEQVLVSKSNSYS
jgi:hypothetical protein